MNWPAPDFSNTPVSHQRPRFYYIPYDMTAPPVVTIITPYYNTSEVFLETAQSVLQQSLQQWEWLIINDGSDNPEALQVLTAFRKKDPRIRVIDLPTNQGLPAARNAGICEARAKYLFFLDSDDMIEPTALEKMAWFLESYPEFGFCKGWTIGFGAQEYLSPVGFESARLFLSRNIVTITSMVKREVALTVGGFDTSLVGGLEDWDFWLRCASYGFWGHTVPEYLDWYRRRQDPSARWATWTSRGLRGMRRELRRRYPVLYNKGMPRVTPAPLRPYEEVRDDLPFENRLAKERTRILLILPWMAMGGADKFNLDLIKQLKQRGYEISIATTLSGNYQWYREFANLTPDIFILPNFLRLTDYPRFLLYLIQSRQIDLVLISNSELGYKFLPYLRSRCPEVTFVDYCHMEEEYWNNGGYPRLSVGYQDLLDLSIVSSNHLKEWMVHRGTNPSKIEVCYTNVDTEMFHPDLDVRLRLRSKLGLPTDIPLILYAGRLCAQKQPRVFARVMRELKARKLGFISLVAGDGEDRRWLSLYIWRHCLFKYVHILGSVSNQQMRELLAASDILFLPSMMEGISLLIYEAMATGVVPVSANVGGQSELVTPECGILVERSSEDEEVKAYADVLERLIRSPELRRSLGAAARERVRSHFEVNQMVDRIDSLLKQAQQIHRSRSGEIVSQRLGSEHAVQGIEYERLSQGVQNLWKYAKVEAIWWRLSGLISPCIDKAGRIAWFFLRPLRKIKDVIWTAGHKVKVRLLSKAG